MKYSKETEDKAYKALQSALARLQSVEPFYYAILSVLDIRFDENDELPEENSSMGININSEPNFELVINPEFFLGLASITERVAMLKHELLHIANGHVSIMKNCILDEDRFMKLNLAQDLAINQYITGLPQGLGVDIAKFKYKVIGKEGEGFKPFPALASWEVYYELLTSDKVQVNYIPKGKGKSEKLDMSSGNGDKTIDTHEMWKEGLSKSSSSSEELLKKTEQLIERAKQKTSCSYDSLPDGIKDFLKYSKAKREELNYKNILMKALKKSLAGGERKYTWERPNKRYGEFAQGNKSNDTPMLKQFIDTSGSISVNEMNSFTSIIYELVKVTGCKSKVNLFHTSIYKELDFGRSSKIDRDNIESGGTDLECVIENIIKTKPDLSVILTDGYYDNVRYESMLKYGDKMPPIVFIITKEGTVDHPLKRLGTTIKIPKGERQ